MKNIVILISGTGSNMQAIVNANIEGAHIAAIISNQETAKGIAWAKEKGIKTTVLNHKDFVSREGFDLVLMKEIDQHQPDLVVLAGFMRILTPAFTSHYEGRLMNIHPSLLPSFTGLHTHQRAIDMGCKIAGVTVHFVTSELDHGPIIAQQAVEIDDQDDAETLAAKVLKIEHKIYPQAVADFVSGSLKIEGLRVLNTQKAHS